MTGNSLKRKEISGLSEKERKMTFLSLELNLSEKKK